MVRLFFALCMWAGLGIAWIIEVLLNRYVNSARSMSTSMSTPPTWRPEHIGIERDQAQARLDAEFELTLERMRQTARRQYMGAGDE
jgi:hypothetical protein